MAGTPTEAGVYIFLRHCLIVDFLNPQIIQCPFFDPQRQAKGYCAGLVMRQRLGPQGHMTFRGEMKPYILDPPLPV